MCGYGMPAPKCWLLLGQIVEEETDTSVLAGFSTHLFSPCASLSLWKYALVVLSSCTQLHWLCNYTELEPHCELQKASRRVCVMHCTAVSMSTCAPLKAAQWMVTTAE